MNEKETMKLPPHYAAFLEEYRTLCHKHGLMVFSEGEGIAITDADEKLWHIEEGSVDQLRWLRIYHPDVHAKIEKGEREE